MQDQTTINEKKKKNTKKEGGVDVVVFLEKKQAKKQTTVLPLYPSMQRGSMQNTCKSQELHNLTPCIYKTPMHDNYRHAMMRQ